VKLPPFQPGDYLIVTADLADRDYPWRHDPTRLARALMDLYEAREA